MDILFSQFEAEVRTSAHTTLAESRSKPGGRDNRCRGGPTIMMPPPHTLHCPTSPRRVPAFPFGDLRSLGINRGFSLLQSLGEMTPRSRQA
jgi:hypothetical protein